MTPNLTRKLVLETRVQTADGAGGFTDSWEERGVLWAEVKHRTGRQVRGRPAATVSLTSYRIVVRAAPFDSPSRPKPEQRFREKSRIYRILAVAEADAQARFLTCFAEEEVPG